MEQRTVSKSGRVWLVSPDGSRRLDPLPNWWSKVDRGSDDECWPWLKGRDKDGYGKFQVGLPGGGQEHVRSHRFGYEALVGPIPDGMVVCHHCDRPACNNPAHWFLGTPLENNDDKVAKNRHAVPWGLPRARMMQTHCKRGHELDGDNLWVNPKTGHRSCKTCARVASLRQYHAKGRQPRPVIVCVDCGEAKPHRAHGRCTNCDAWWRRKGEPRPRQGVTEGARTA
jgi:hypothetical protein